MKQPIAMRCTKKQFKSVKNKLKKTEDIESFKHNPYLVTNLCNIDGLVSNVDKKRSRDYNRKIYEEWNEKIFLEALGIETEGAKDIILEKVKEYFKNAKTVRCLHNLKEASIVDNITSEIYGDNKDFWINSSTHDGEGILLYDNGKFAEILTYKEKTFSITESQINNLKKDIKNGYHVDAIEYLEKLYPDVLQLEKDKWAYHIEKGIIYFNSKDKNSSYGFNASGDWTEGFDIYVEDVEFWREATEQEVFEALKNEAVKRGFKEGDIITDIYYPGAVTLNSNGFKLKTENELWLGDCVIFYNGVWAEKTITLSEAEQQLGKKIIV